VWPAKRGTPGSSCTCPLRTYQGDQYRGGNTWNVTLVSTYTGVCSESPRGTGVIHSGADELLTYKDTVPEGDITSPVQERTQRTHTLSRALPNLIAVRRTGESCV